MAGSGRHRSDALIIAALLSGATVPYAALRAGVAERTVRRRLADAEFQTRLRAAQAEYVAGITRALVGASIEAIAHLLELMRTAPPAVRLGAARTIIELAGKWRFEGELEERLVAVEQTVAELQSER